MRRAIVATILVLLFASLPAGALPTPSPGPFLEHAPILVEGDANFTAAQGVVSGNGTAGDPYVISGWSIHATNGVGIRIHNATRAFTVRDNSIAARYGIQVEQTSSVGLVQNNKLVTMGVGISVTNADAIVIDNSFVGDTSFSGVNQGVALSNSNSRVESNAFIYTPYGIDAYLGSPTIRCNDIHDDSVVSAIRVRFTTNATIECNTITSCQGGIVSVNAIGTIIVNNSINTCATGISLVLTKDATVANNTVRFSLGAQIDLWHVSGSVTGNVLIDGRADAIVMEQSPMLVANNTIIANAGAGIRLKASAAEVQANVVSRNSFGIVLEGSPTHLTANVLTNNTVGLSIPYDSRQAIVWLSANIVNGVNVDGTLRANEKVFFYKEANVSIVGGVRDSGFAAGYFGSISAQGNIVLYEVDTATVSGTLIGHADIGVNAVNSFNVVVTGATIVQAHVGVSASSALGFGPVPACVVSVKDTNITIPVDPVGTIGISVTTCRAQILRTNISLVDTGIVADGQSPLVIANASITQTGIGLDISGLPHNVNLSGSVVAHNRMGVLARGTIGDFVDNRFEANAGAGVALRNGADLHLLGNVFLGNGGSGLQDTQACGGAYSCGRVEAEGNLFRGNGGDGASVNGSSTWRGDVFTANRGTGARLGSAITLRGVVAMGNDVDGIEARGTFVLRDSDFEHNGRHGLSIVGSGDIRNSTFAWNTAAGIRASATHVTAYDLNVSHNFDGILFDENPAQIPSTLPPISLPGIWELIGAGAGATLVGPDPMDVHHSRFLANERDAIRAGGALVNATLNYYGTIDGPAVSIADQVGAFRNGVSPTVRFVPYYEDAGMTTTGPVSLL